MHLLQPTTYNLRPRRGQMLVEAMVAMGILTVAVFAIFSLLTRSTSLNRVISQQYVATYLAAEGLELVKNITDTNQLTCQANWTDGAVAGAPTSPRKYEVDFRSWELDPTPSGAKLKINDEGQYQYLEGDESPFERLITVESVADGIELRVTSIVTWRSRGGVENEIRLEDHFFNWRPDPVGCL